MNNELESIDKYLVSEIEDVELSPSDSVWRSVETKLQRKESARNSRNKNFRLFTGAAVLICATAIVTNYYYHSGEQNLRANDQVTITKKTGVSAQQPVTMPSAPVNNIAENKKDLNKTGKDAGTHMNPASETNSTEATNLITEENYAGADDKREAAVITTKPVVSLTDTKKQNNDKSIILLPYFSPNPASNNSAEISRQRPPENNISVKNDLVESAKSEPKENVIYIPNAFTPNGDGLNDVFLPQTSEIPKEYRLSIFDRLGRLVFYSDDVQKGWDGRSIVNGAEEVKEDVYMWRIEMKNAKGEKEHLMGSLTLLK